VAKRVGHDLTEVSNVDPDAFDRPTCGGLVGNLGDRGADRKFVHAESLEKKPVLDRLDNDAIGI
jgi:hypothetical protein